MNIYQSRFGLKTNLGKSDRLLRYLAGAVLIGLLLIMSATAATDWSVGWLVLLPLLSIPIVISAIMRWDPVYAMLRISSV